MGITLTHPHHNLTCCPYQRTGSTAHVEEASASLTHASLGSACVSYSDAQRQAPLQGPWAAASQQSAASARSSPPPCSHPLPVTQRAAQRVAQRAVPLPLQLPSLPRGGLCAVGDISPRWMNPRQSVELLGIRGAMMSSPTFSPGDISPRWTDRRLRQNH